MQLILLLSDLQSVEDKYHHRRRHHHRRRDTYIRMRVLLEHQTLWVISKTFQADKSLWYSKTNAELVTLT